MKVLHVIPSMSPARGGPGFALRQTMIGLAARGITVHVAATDDDGPDAHLSVPHGVGVEDSGGTCFYFPRQTRFYSFSWPLTEWLKKHIADYDVVHIHALFSYPSTAAARIARRAGVPYLLRPLGTLAQWGLQSRRPILKRASLNLIERRMMEGAAAVHATSHQEREEVLAACPTCRPVVVPNPVKIPATLPWRPVRDVPSKILFVSRIDPKKGLEILLPAFDRVASANPQLQLCVAGDGVPEYVASIHRLAASLASRERITFAGNVGAERKAALFADADLFVLPSHSENFGIAVVEAMAHSVPVLISPNVGIHREVTQADAGQTADTTVDAFAEALSKILADPAELARLGANGRRLALTRYAPDVVAMRLESVYRDAIAHTEATLRNRRHRIA